MGKLNRVQEPSLAESFEEVVNEPVERSFSVRFEKGVVSTGSTLLDLAISGGRIRGGGIPGGIIVEISGPPSTGKTALLAEILGSVQRKGGDTEIKDPEARLDEEYAEIYGVHIDKKKYSKADTVSEVFDGIFKWKPKPEKKDAICAQGIDSLAALSTEMEMKAEDKRGQRRAKEFSEGLRKTCRIIEKENWLIICTNQEREGDSGPVTPGGKGIPYYASLRIRLTQSYPKWRIEKSITYEGKELKSLIGVITHCRINKSSIDRPFREADFSIIYNYGIHDVMANLQYFKETRNLSRYMAVNKSFQSLEDAAAYIEGKNLEVELRDMVIDLWEDVQKAFEVQRKLKVRF